MLEKLKQRLRNGNNELVVLFKVVNENFRFKLIPYKVIEGYYEIESDTFIDKKGTEYAHVINEPQYFGFLYRKDIKEYTKDYPNLPLGIIKMLILGTLKKYNYYCEYDYQFDMPRVIKEEKNNKRKYITVLDSDIEKFYQVYRPDYLNSILGIYMKEEPKKQTVETSKNTDEEINIDINSLYSAITDNVIDQDEAIKKILTAVWKQYRGFSDNKSRNIFINGSTGVGKTEIFRVLTKLLNVPCYITSATEYTASGYVGKSVNDIFYSLLSRAGGDIERAQNGVLIIDEIDKIASEGAANEVNKKDVQEELLKIVEDGTFDLYYKGKNISFNTGKLLVIAMGSFSRISLEEKKVVGFENKSIKKEYKDLTREDFIKNGIIPELMGRFPVIVQMNELNIDSFIKILKNAKENALNKNKEFFKKQGIELEVTESAIEEIARKAEKGSYGARNLDSIIEDSLASASFEIASNPEEYEKLIITPETINDNNKYKLVKKKKN